MGWKAAQNKSLLMSSDRADFQMSLRPSSLPQALPILTLTSAQIISVSDASFANLEDAGSQGGIITFLLGQNGQFAPLTWHSKKIKRVVKSTLGAEILALLEGAESSFMMKSFISEIYQLPSAESIQITCVIDNQSLNGAAYSTKTITDRRLKVDMCAVRDMLKRSEIQQTEAGKQLSDCLTKKGASSMVLLKSLRGEGPLL